MLMKYLIAFALIGCLSACGGGSSEDDGGNGTVIIDPSDPEECTGDSSDADDCIEVEDPEECTGDSSDADDCIEVEGPEDCTGDSSDADDCIEVEDPEECTGDSSDADDCIEVDGPEECTGDSSGADDCIEPETCTAEVYTIEFATDDGNSHTDYPPSLAIDGITTDLSRWSSEGTDKKITLDLGVTKTVAALQLMWLKGDERTTNFSVETSTDNSTWTEVITTQNSAGTTDFEPVNLPESISAQYLKIIGHGNTSNDWNSLIEVEVHKCAITDDDDTDGSEINECDALGQMLYNGACAPYSEVYEVENGIIDEDAHLITDTDTDFIEMTFDALAAQHVTENGNGWRHELKIKSSGGYRVAMTEVYELFKATITAELSSGSKIIVAQHHAADTATITKLYIADLDEGDFENAPDGTESNSIAKDGIFDVYIRLADPDGDGETKHLLTTIVSGGSFDFEEENDHGVITVKINGVAISSIEVADSSESYFKFGNYHQAQNPDTGKKLASGDTDGDWAEFYAEYFTTSKITFTNMSYTRTVD